MTRGKEHSADIVISTASTRRPRARRSSNRRTPTTCRSAASLPWGSRPRDHRLEARLVSHRRGV